MRALRLIAILIAALITAAAMCSCSGDTAEKADIYALADEMAAASELPEMLTINKGDSREEKGFSAISDLDFGKVEEFSLMYSADGSSYELAVIMLKNESDMPALESSLREHIHNRAEQYRYYDASQAPRAENAAVAVSGRYAALIMCDDISSVKAVFDKAFS